MKMRLFLALIMIVAGIGLVIAGIQRWPPLSTTGNSPLATSALWLFVMGVALAGGGGVVATYLALHSTNKP